MGLIKEPKEIDFYVDSRPLTAQEEKAISEFIKADKLKRKKLRTRRVKPASRMVSRKTV